MSREVRVFAEGALRWVQASGTGFAWATASAAQTALVGFVQAGTNFQSAQNLVQVKDRGAPNHIKIVGSEFIPLQLTYLEAVTANMPRPATASGVSTPAVHFELKYDDDELGGGTAIYYQFRNAVFQDGGWTEGEEGNQWQENWLAVSYVGPTGSGYIA